MVVSVVSVWLVADALLSMGRLTLVSSLCEELLEPLLEELELLPLELLAHLEYST